MAVDHWGLTERGFRRPSYVELLDAFEHKARELFPASANLTVRSPLGMWCRIFAWFTSLLFGVLEDVYNSRFIDTAAGASLYNLGRIIGQRLLSNQRATGYLEIRGAPGTLIPAGWLAANVEGIQFVVMQEGTVGESGVILLAAQAVAPGEDGNLRPGSVTVVVNPVIPAGVDSVTNPDEFKGGRLRETDEQFRDRYYREHAGEPHKAYLIGLLAEHAEEEECTGELLAWIRELLAGKSPRAVLLRVDAYLPTTGSRVSKQKPWGTEDPLRLL
ncbi:MAG: baseplate J/gp47 family protein, partial [Oscillospiraceae bacterium]|nr:baseplate J/gp47 family protein [Oscillospiraceae bacterium]